MFWNPENLPEEIAELRDKGALFCCSHSGGKDSQAMLIYLKRHIPVRQLIVVHAHLPSVEWEGTWEHVQYSAGNIPSFKVQARKSLFDMARSRGRFPSPKYRQCTSDLKRNPINSFVRGYLKSHPEFKGIVVNCMGMRAEESSKRASLKIFKLNHHETRNKRVKRTWNDWLPIHEMFLFEVFNTIKSAGEVPHWAYAKGMSRLSCCFCIMSSKPDLCTAAKLNPKLFKAYVDLEKELNHSLMMPTKNKPPKFLEEFTGISAKERSYV